MKHDALWYGSVAEFKMPEADRFSIRRLAFLTHEDRHEAGHDADRLRHTAARVDHFSAPWLSSSTSSNAPWPRTR
ncbi:hypothetical protein [Massilia sp. S19_KUP03_FR1]|uniref:hypothetical protein n=1 Tax=Massilia sp. S19_KUP03_FR1 TaxID=3025503 RepID=UPI002FCD7D39